MKLMLEKRHVVGLGALALIAAWVPSAYAATPEERAKCEAMFKQMGLDFRGMNKSGQLAPMTEAHMRCKNILAEPHQGHKDGDKHDQK